MSGLTSAELRAQISRPEVAKMKMIGDGLKVGKVMGNRVLIEPVQPATDLDRIEKEGTLFIPDGKKKEYTPKPSTGIVLAVGSEVESRMYTEDKDEDGEFIIYPNPIKPGALVLFSRHAGMSILVDKKELMIMDYSDIACTLEAVDGDLGDKVGPDVETALPVVNLGGTI